MKPPQDEMEQLKFLWDGSETGWTLFNLEPTQEEDAFRYCIYNEQTKVDLTIEDDQLYRDVIDKMKSMNVRVITSFNQS